jgi:LacI family repressor for deo operon, udp, cdd, tsx, nupC, and nupG
VANIFEVAKQAGVSIATVSRVLSKPAAVTPTTRRRVLQAIEQLGYATNHAGKQLRTQRSGKLLVTVPDITNPFYSRVLQSIEEAAQQEGYAVLLGDTQHDPKREEWYTLMLRRREAEGLIMLGHGLVEAAVALSKQSNAAPIVSGCEFNPRAGIPSVHIDNQAAARDAMEHLYALGHRRIGIVTGPPASGLSRDRLQGVRAVAGDGELIIVQGDFTLAFGEEAAEQLLARPDRPTAIFCFNDQMAIGVLAVARRRRLSVPADLSVVGFDDISFARYNAPRLTTVAQPVKEMGQETVRLLLAVINGQTSAPVSIILPHTLVVRESTGPAPGAIAPTRDSSC